MKRGLVLGKFAPFHEGHQQLVEKSLELTDQTIVLVYDSPEVTRIPVETRARWIRKIYPQAEVIEGNGSPADEGNDPRVMRIQEEYIRKVVPQPITHFISSEWYGAHVSHALGAIDVRMDRHSSRSGVSGTAIRANPFDHRNHVHPYVYRDLVRWIVLVGAESTGKSELTRELAIHYQTEHVQEHGREFWLSHHDPDGILSLRQLAQLADEHRNIEETAVLKANRLLFCDTDARITRQYSCWYHDGSVDPKLAQYADECRDRYHLTILCGDDIPYIDDGTRAGPVRRRQAQQELMALLDAAGVDWVDAKGSLKQRVQIVTDAIRERRLDCWC